MHPDTCPHCGNDDSRKLAQYDISKIGPHQYAYIKICLVCGVLFTPDVLPATTTATTVNQEGPIPSYAQVHCSCPIGNDTYGVEHDESCFFCVPF